METALLSLASSLNTLPLTSVLNFCRYLLKRPDFELNRQYLGKVCCYLYIQKVWASIIQKHKLEETTVLIGYP